MFFQYIFWRLVSAVLRPYRPAKKTDVKEQRFCIKLCFKLGKTAAEIPKMLKEEFGDNSLGQIQTYEWFKRLKNGRMSVDGDERTGRFDRNHDRKCGKSVRGYPERSKTKDSRLLQHCRIVVRNVSTNFVPMSSTCGALQQNMCQGWLAMINRNTVLLSALSSRNMPKTTPTSSPTPLLVTNLRYDPKTKQQSSQWKTTTSPRPKKAEFRNNIKLTLIFLN